MAKIHDHVMRGEREIGLGGRDNMERGKEKECGAGREEGHGVGEVGGGNLAQKE